MFTCRIKLYVSIRFFPGSNPAKPSRYLYRYPSLASILDRLTGSTFAGTLGVSFTGYYRLVSRYLCRYLSEMVETTERYLSRYGSVGWAVRLRPY